MPLFTKWIIKQPYNYIPVIGYLVLFALVNGAYQMMFLTVSGKDKMYLSADTAKHRKSKIRILIFGAVLIGLELNSFILPNVTSFLLIVLPILLFFTNSDGNARPRSNRPGIFGRLGRKNNQPPSNET
jgi:uncharacterized membrane protein